MIYKISSSANSQCENLLTFRVQIHYGASLGNKFLVLFFYFDFLVFLDVFWCAEFENDVSFFVVSTVFL